MRVGGIEIVIDYSWFIIFFLVIYTMAESYFPHAHPHYSTPQYWLMGAITAVIFFLSILFHEIAHSIVSIKFGIKVTSIRLLVFGGLAQVSAEPKNGRHEFLIALSGPATSMALGVIFLLIYSIFIVMNRMTPAAGIAGCLALANFSLAFFNIIPGFPLDGGRILRAFLWDRWNDRTRATRVVSQIGNTFAIFLLIFGVLQILITQSILSGLWLVFIGLFMKQSAAGSYQAVMMQRALSGVQVRQIMTENLISVDWLVPVNELVQNYVYKHQFSDYPVFNRDEFVGMVSLDGVKTISKELWHFKQVRDIMTPAELVPCLQPNEDATDALTKMIAENVDQMPVVAEGRLLGIVSRRDIMNLFKIKTDLGVA
jgi:Zn-dependent protease/predicted transcriptional regulator